MPDVAAPARGAAPQPRTPRLLRTATEATFAGLARLRGARPFHPRGRSFEATLEPRPGQPLEFLGDAPRPALVRLSNSLGLPAWSPDVLGIGIRIPGAGAQGRPQDFLLASSGEAPVLRHLLAPARGFHTRRYSSLLLYRHAGRLRLVGARHSGPPPRGPLRLADLDRAAGRGALVFTLAVASPGGRWEPVAELRTGAPLPAADSRALRFHPWNTASELRPVGPLNHLRAGAYDGSQRTATSE